MTDWKQLLEKRIENTLNANGYPSEECITKANEMSSIIVWELEPLLLKAIEALEDIKRHSNGCSVCGASELADTAIAEIKAELELNEKE